jgi:thioesterase domain-containing protein
MVYAGGYYIEGLSRLPKWKRDIINEHVHVWRSYVPQPLEANIVLFRATQQPPGMSKDRFLGWRELAMGGLDVIDIPGTHNTIIRSPLIASELDKYLKG